MKTFCEKAQSSCLKIIKPLYLTYGDDLHFNFQCGIFHITYHAYVRKHPTAKYGYAISQITSYNT